MMTEKTGPAAVCLVQMPYGSIARPSLGLSLLKSCLAADGIPAEIVYGNVDFAERIGLDVYGMIELSSPEVLLGEWTFAAAAFPDFDRDHGPYLKSLRHSAFASELARWLEFCYAGLDLEQLAWRVRAQAGAFLDLLADDILRRKPKIVGCTSMFQQHCAALALLRKIKEREPGITTMIGGPNCEESMGRATHQAFPWLDFVVSGEADTFFAPLVRSILDEGPELPVSRLPQGVWGPAHRPGAAPAAAVDPGHGFVSDMDRLPTPDYDEYFARLEGSPLAPFIRPALLLESSRGCWWGAHTHCTFCGLNGQGMAYRKKAPQRVVDELSQVTGRYGVREVEFADNILDFGYLSSLIPTLAEQNPDYKIFFEIKPNLKREHLKLLSDAGIRWVQPGVESLHAEILRRLKKGVSPLQNVQLLKWCREFGTHTYYSLLFGLPDDDDRWYAEMAAWMPLISHLQPPFASSKIRFDRFSPYHREAEAYGLALVPKRQYSYVYPLSREALRDIAYYFEDYTRTGRGVVNPKNGPVQEGLKAFQESVTRWRHLWLDPRRPEPPSFTMVDEGDRILLRDTRPISASGEPVALTGAACDVYRLCTEARSAASVAQALDGKMDRDSVLAVLADLTARHLMVSLDGRHLSLAVPAGHRPYPPERGAPLALVDYKSYYQLGGPRELASAVRA